MCHLYMPSVTLFSPYKNFFHSTVFARKSALFELGPPILIGIVNESLPRVSAPLFSQKGTHLKNSI